MCKRDVCELCGWAIEEVRDTTYFWDEKTKSIRARHKRGCQEIEKKSPYFYMKRVGQLKHD